MIHKQVVMLLQTVGTKMLLAHLHLSHRSRQILGNYKLRRARGGPPGFGGDFTGDLAEMGDLPKATGNGVHWVH